MQLKPGQTWPTEHDVMYDFAYDWAERMERQMANGNKTVAEVAESARKKAKYHRNQSGYSYSVAVATLAEKWVHGDALRAWENARWGVESDQVYNPCVIETRDDITAEDVRAALEEFAKPQ